MQAPQSLPVMASVPAPSWVSRTALMGCGLAICLLAIHAPEVGAQMLERKPAVAPSLMAANLPAALQPVVARYPVKLYTSPDCSACQLGRELLERRGVPFQEFRITSPEEQRAAHNQGISTLPHLMIGAQALKGFDSLDWTNYLSAAGYPLSSALPPSYQAPPVQSVLPEPAREATSLPRVSDPRPSSSSSTTDQNSSAPTDGFRF